MKLRNAFAVFLLSAATTAAAQDVTIGIRVPPGSMDPHLSWLSSDAGYYRNVYEALYEADANLQLHPHLATGHDRLDDLTWTFTLRRGVKFHDGTDFDAQDVVATFSRVGTVEGNDGLVADLLAPIEKIEAIDTHTIRVTTKAPTPDVIRRMSVLLVLPSELPIDTKSDAFASPAAAIGTGAMKLVEWKRGSGMKLERNGDYWGEAAPFEHVELKEISSDAARVAALRAGDVDIIDYVPPLDAKTLEKDADLGVWMAPSARVIFMMPNSVAKVAPMTTAKDGSALDANPFADEKVRRALDLAINREVIVARVLEGLAFEANQLVPDGFLAYSDEVPANSYDPSKAQMLLAEAGYPNGFSTTIACPNDRYIKDAAICQAIGQMVTSIGIDVNIETMPKAVYFGRLLASEFPIAMLGWGNNDGSGASILASVLHSRNKDKGYGSWNPTYANPDLDAIIEMALTTMDEAARGMSMKSAISKAREDIAAIPLHAQPVITATRKGLSYAPSADEQMLVRNITINN